MGRDTTTQEDEVTEVGLQARIITFRTHNFVVDQHIRQHNDAAAEATVRAKKRRRPMMIITDASQNTQFFPKEKFLRAKVA